MWIKMPYKSIVCHQVDKMSTMWSWVSWEL